LTTDFGTEDWFVGAMKGVILGLAPKATVVDITHDIPAGDIRSGAFALAAACRCFPKGTIHVAVIDPGVGSRRNAIAVRMRNQIFVGPDNGVLSLALAGEEIVAAHRLENEKYFRLPVSRTFHGRDVFAPVAAHLSRGVALARMGPKVGEFVKLGLPAARVTKNGIHGEIIYLDRFGNAFTNITAELLPQAGQPVARVLRKGKRLCRVAEFYQAVSAGQPVAVIGSSGHLEIAVNGGNAASKLRLRIGDAIDLTV
jgi:S-adenosylmethionine hydrolase